VALSTVALDTRTHGYAMDERSSFAASRASTSFAVREAERSDYDGTVPARSRPPHFFRTVDFWACVAIGIALTLGVTGYASSSPSESPWRSGPARSATAFSVGSTATASAARGIAPQLGRKASTLAALAETAHIRLGKHKVAFVTVCTGGKLPSAYDLVASAEDVNPRIGFIIGCADSACLQPLLQLNAPVFDASASEARFAYEDRESLMPEHASRWARLEAARELLERGYVVVIAAPTVRFRRNPIDFIEKLLARDGRTPTVYATRGVHSYNVTAREAEMWTVSGSSASVMDEFEIFTPGSQTLINAMFNHVKNAPVPEAVRERFVDSPPGTAEKHWKENAAFVMNWVLNREGGLKWHSLSGDVVDASPFEIRPREISLDPNFIVDGDVVRGDSREVRGRTVGHGGLDAIDVVLLDPIMSRAHCNGVDNLAMRQTYVVTCDLDDAALAGRRVEVDSQCVLMKALESSAFAGAGLGFMENRGDSPIGNSRGFLGALNACRL